MIVVAAVLGGLGITCMLYRPTLLGFLVGVQLLILGSTFGFVIAGVSSSETVEGHIFGFFILTGSIGVFSTILGLVARLFFLKGNTAVEELTTLKN